MAANYQRLQIRRGTVTSFASFNPVLASGEPAIALENGSGLFKVGDGHTQWNNLAGRRLDIDESPTLSGISVFASGQSVLLNTALDIVSGISIFASGNGGGGGDVSTAQHQGVSGIAAFASGQIVGNHINIDNLSGVVSLDDPSDFPRFIFKPSGQTLNTQTTVVSNDLRVGSTPLGGFRTGSIGQHLTIISGISVYASGSGGGGGDVSTAQFNIVSGIAVFASGKALAGGGSGPSTAQHQIVSGIAVYSSGQSLALAASSGALNTSVGLLNTASGALNTSVGLLNTSSGVLNTNVGLLQVASGSLNTTAGLNTSNFQTLSGITSVSQSGNFGYNSSASGNISGILNMVMVDQAAYNSLVKKTNTLYFIPSG